MVSALALNQWQGVQVPKRPMDRHAGSARVMHPDLEGGEFELIDGLLLPWLRHEDSKVDGLVS